MKYKEMHWVKSHGMTHTRIHRIWRDMRSRCNNPKAQNYKDYGGRGITICKEWLDDFIAFYHWAGTNGYQCNLSIDRINNDGNYEPGNCRWVNKSIQNMNRRIHNSSGLTGICWHSSGKFWYGRIKVNGKYVYTGKSEDKMEAAQKRNNYIILHGLKNRLNEVPE